MSIIDYTAVVPGSVWSGVIRPNFWFLMPPALVRLRWTVDNATHTLFLPNTTEWGTGGTNESVYLWDPAAAHSAWLTDSAVSGDGDVVDRSGVGTVQFGFLPPNATEWANGIEVSNVTLISACPDANLDPRFGCMACHARFNEVGTVCSTCAAGYFSPYMPMSGTTLACQTLPHLCKCSQTEEECAEQRCTGHGACTTEQPTVSGRHCSCDESWYGRFCSANATDCAVSRCNHPAGACIADLEGCMCTEFAVGVSCGICVDGRATSVDAPLSPCEFCEEGLYGPWCNETEPSCLLKNTTAAENCTDLSFVDSANTSLTLSSDVAVSCDCYESVTATASSKFPTSALGWAVGGAAAAMLTATIAYLECRKAKRTRTYEEV